MRVSAAAKTDLALLLCPLLLEIADLLLFLLRFSKFSHSFKAGCKEYNIAPPDRGGSSGRVPKVHNAPRFLNEACVFWGDGGW